MTKKTFLNKIHIKYCTILLVSVLNCISINLQRITSQLIVTQSFSTYLIPVHMCVLSLCVLAELPIRDTVGCLHFGSPVINWAIYYATMYLTCTISQTTCLLFSYWIETGSVHYATLIRHWSFFFCPKWGHFDHVIQSFFQHELCYVMYRSHPENSLYTLCGLTFSIILYQKSNKLSTYPLKCRKEADYIPCSIVWVYYFICLLLFVNKGNILQVNLRSAWIIANTAQPCPQEVILHACASS